MKLQAQYNKITIISTLIIMAIAATGYHYLLKYVLIDQLDEALKVEEAEIYDYIKKYNKLPEATVYKDQRIAFEETDHIADRDFKSLHAFHPGESKVEASRQLVFPVEVNGQWYIASVTKSEQSTENLVWIILLTTIALVVLLTLILFLTNRFLFKKLWQPFRTTLTSIKKFNLSEPSAINTQATKIEEFEELNESIKLMVQKVTRDYESLKHFTDHASHEIQTPLAVIISKLDVLIQEPELGEKSLEQIQGIYNAVNKLSRLTQSLLLLTKIENNQYHETGEIAISFLVKEKVYELQDWLRSKNIRVDLESEPFPVNMNKELAEILVSNLITNAVRHSTMNSFISIICTSKKLIVSNSGVKSLNKDRITDRFYKSEDSEGSGLGLAIVQQICEQYRFSMTYEFVEGKHTFSVHF